MYEHCRKTEPVQWRRPGLFWMQNRLFGCWVNGGKEKENEPILFFLNPIVKWKTAIIQLIKSGFEL